MAWVNHLLLFYALASIGLGAFGGQKTGSVVSLIAGAVIGLLVLGSLALYKTHPRAARITAAVIALLVTGQMGGNMVSKGFQWHHTAMTLLSMVVVVALVAAHFSAMSKRKAEGTA